MSTANYSVFIDWDNDGGLNLSDFEDITDDWEEYGTTPPTVSVSTAQSYTGESSLKVVWTAYNPFQFDVSGKGFDQGRFGAYNFQNSAEVFKFGVADRGFDEGRFGFAALEDPSVDFPAVRKVVDNLVVGREYTLSAWVFVPSGDVSITVGVVDVAESSASSMNDDWEQLSVTFTATSTNHILFMHPSANPATSDLVYMDQVMLLGPGENVTSDVLARTEIQYKRGRDMARSLGAIEPSETNLELFNQDKDYTPNNVNTPIGQQYVTPGKPVLIKASFNSQEYRLFEGFTEEFVIRPHHADPSVELSAMDQLGKMGEQSLYTELYFGLRTGAAINIVLDEINWPKNKRLIDSGATVMTHWWADDEPALEAINKILDSEGPPAIAFIDPQGYFVYKDRHHRLLNTESQTVQSTWNDDDTEPSFSLEGFEYNVGWRDVINKISIDVTQRKPNAVPQEIFEFESPTILSALQSRSFSVNSDDPFFDAITPVEGEDYDLLSGDIDISFSKTSGASLKITMTAGASGAHISGFSVRATTLAESGAIRVEGESPDSIDTYGVNEFDGELPWCNINDATAITEIILGLRETRNPTITLSMNNETDTRMEQILTRELSDRIHINEPESITNSDFYIETVEHVISQAGLFHTAKYGCEEAYDQVDTVFTFDVAGQGFDDGLFGRRGIDDPTDVFVIGTSQLDTGLLGH